MNEDPKTPQPARKTDSLSAKVGGWFKHAREAPQADAQAVDPKLAAESQAELSPAQSQSSLEDSAMADPDDTIPSAHPGPEAESETIEASEERADTATPEKDFTPVRPRATPWSRRQTLSGVLLSQILAEEASEREQDEEDEEEDEDQGEDYEEGDGEDDDEEESTGGALGVSSPSRPPTGVTETLASEPEESVDTLPVESMLPQEEWTARDASEVEKLYDLGSNASLLKRAFESVPNRDLSELEEIVCAIHEGVVAIDSAGGIRYANDSAARLLGSDRSELLGQPLHELTHLHYKDGSVYPFDECPTFATITFGQTTRNDQEVFWTKHGQSFPVSYSCSPIRDGETIVGAVVVFNDITERRLLETQLAQADRMTSLGRLAATVAHEFDDLLEGLDSLAPILERHSGSHPEIHSASNYLEQSLERGRKLTRRILQFTEPKRASMQLVDVKEWMNEFATQVRRILPESIKLDASLPPEPLYLLGDRAQLNQIFMNLVLNARDAMAEGGFLTVGVDPCLSGTSFSFGILETPDQFLHFIVRDTGCGISAEIMPRVFEPLFSTKVSSSAGLGLAVCHQLVQRHGGSIFAESTMDLGTTFHVFLPATLPELFEQPALERAHPRARKVVLVEDTVNIVSGRMNLANFGDLDMEVVPSGEGAEKVIEKFEPDALVLHASRLEVDGLEAYCRIAEAWPTLRILISVVGVTNPRRRADSPPNLTYLPYDVETILKSIENQPVR